MVSTYDFIIIGAGILGLTTANELRKRYPESRIAILEKEERVGMHASGRNSGVLHSGIYYGSETLKAKVCSKGASKMRQFAEKHRISCQRSGKIILAASDKDLPAIDRLIANALQNNIRAERLDAIGIKNLEPYANQAFGGIYSPDTAVIDGPAVLKKLTELLLIRGIDIIYNQKIQRIKTTEKRVYSSDRDYDFGFLFNCAGAGADIIAKKMNLGAGYALLPFKGIYYKIRSEKSYLVKSSIYPVPDLNLPFLGVHLTRVISGDVYVGPTAIPAFGRENYGLLKGIKLFEGGIIGWQLVTLYLKNKNHFRLLVNTELRKYIKRYFLETTRRLVPDLRDDDLIPSNKVGIRPQLVNTRTKSLEMDYIIEQDSISMHVLNAISPAFTSSFAFAELLVDRYESAVKN
ncbi:MAG: L-2-hydroxyglutarate oxidase [Nitrospirae bacterium]|nr:L-2-hydroxyglutarate oxidase [Nitrospirota bacterium]